MRKFVSIVVILILLSCILGIICTKMLNTCSDAAELAPQSAPIAHHPSVGAHATTNLHDSFSVNPRSFMNNGKPYLVWMTSDAMHLGQKLRLAYTALPADADSVPAFTNVLPDAPVTPDTLPMIFHGYGKEKWGTEN